MSINLNLVIFAGNMTRDPEEKQVGESVVVTFTIAQNRKYKSKSGEENEEVTFLDIEAWGKSGELIAKYGAKGKPMIVEGGLRQQKWKDKDGNPRSKMVLRLDKVHFLSDGRNSERGAGLRTENAVEVDAPPF